MKNFIWLCGGSCLVFGVGTTVHAQVPVVPSSDDQVTADSPDQEQTQEIVVTAQKRQQSLNDVGATINVVSGEVLAQRAITTMSDLSRLVPGFTVAENVDGFPIYTLRGVSFNATAFGTAPTVSVYVDEAPLPFSVMTQGAVLLDLERVEVLKGPQGTLFGQNATAGAFNYIAAKPTDRLSAGVTATYGRFDTFIAQGFVSGPLSENLGARVAVSGTTSGPWQQSITRDDQLGRQRKAAARVLLDWEPNNELRFMLNLNGWLDRSENLAPQLVQRRPTDRRPAYLAALDASPLTAIDARTADWDPERSFKRDNSFYQLSLRTEYDFLDAARLTSITGYTRASLNNDTEVDGTSTAFQWQKNQGYVQAFNQELRLSGEVLNDRVTYLLGGSYQDDKSSEDRAFFFPAFGLNVPGFGAFDSVLVQGLQRNKVIAGFVNLDWKIVDRLTLSGGFRQTYVKHSSDGCSRDTGNGQAAAVLGGLSTFLRNALLRLPPAPGFGPGQCVTLGPQFEAFRQVDSFNEDNFSWRLNANYKASNDLLLYVLASRGFKAGNYPVPAASSFSQLAPVRQEQLTSYEAGVKARLFDRLMSVNAAIFHYDYRDKQLQTIFFDPVFAQLLRVENIPRSKVTGFDADVTLRPVRGVTLSSAVTYADSQVGTYSSRDIFGAPVDLKGRPFNLAPKWITVSDAEFRKPLTDSLDGLIGASYTYNSRTFADLAGTSSLEIRPFGLLDLRAGIRTDEWDLTGFVKNVSNEYYWNYASTGGASVLRFPAMPRTYGLTLSYRYQ